MAKSLLSFLTLQRFSSVFLYILWTGSGRSFVVRFRQRNPKLKRTPVWCSDSHRRGLTPACLPFHLSPPVVHASTKTSRSLLGRSYARISPFTHPSSELNHLMFPKRVEHLRHHVNKILVCSHCDFLTYSSFVFVIRLHSHWCICCRLIPFRTLIIRYFDETLEILWMSSKN